MAVGLGVYWVGGRVGAPALQIIYIYPYLTLHVCKLHPSTRKECDWVKKGRGNGHLVVTCNLFSHFLYPFLFFVGCMTAYAMWQRVWLLSSRAPSSYWTWIFVGVQLCYKPEHTIWCLYNLFSLFTCSQSIHFLFPVFPMIYTVKLLNKG